MYRFVLFIPFMLLAMVSPLGAESLWSDTGFGSKLFVDHRGRTVGDTITILLEETVAATQKANTSLDNSSDLSVGPGTGLLAFGNDPSGSNGVKEADKFKGTGTTDRSSSLSGTIAARVVEVLTNGELRIQGRKETKINDETQVIEVSGIVRPEDIGLDNTVRSSSLSNSKIAYLGAGPVGDSQAPGFVTKMFNWLF